jgi:hypothetical protein
VPYLAVLPIFEIDVALWIDGCYLAPFATVVRSVGVINVRNVLGLEPAL